jgi:hypothetical protein
MKAISRRRSRAEWAQLVAAWRRSGESGGSFAARRGVVEGTLRWWAWRLEGEGGADVGDRTGSVSLVPLRLVEGEEGIVDANLVASSPASDAGVSWTLRTNRGELRGYGPGTTEVLLAAVAAMLEDGS